MAHNETPEGKEVTRDAAIESTATAESSSSTEQAAEIKEDIEPAKKQAPTKKTSPQKKPSPQRQVSSKKKAAPKKKAMPKKKAARARSSAKKATARPKVRDANSTQTKQPTAVENVRQSPPTGIITKSQASATPTRFRDRVGVWLPATIFLLIGVAAYFLYRPIDTLENTAANAPSFAVVTKRGGEQISASETSQSTPDANNTPSDKLIIEEIPDQGNAEAPSVPAYVEPTESDAITAGQPTENGAAISVPGRATQVLGNGVEPQESPSDHSPTKPEDTLGQTSSGTYSVPSPGDQASQADTRISHPPQASKPTTRADSVDINMPAINQPGESRAEAGAVTTAPSTNQEDAQTATARPTKPAASDIQQIPPVTSSEDKTAAVKKMPTTPMARTPAPRADFANQPPAGRTAWLPRYPSQMRQYQGATPRPYGWNNPYDLYGRVMPYSMGPHYFPYRRLPPARSEKPR